MRRWLIGILVALAHPAEDGEARDAEHRRAEHAAAGFRIEAPGVYVWDETRTEIEAWRQDLGVLDAQSAPRVVCGVCHRLRNDLDEWEPPRPTMDPRVLSHGICPDCARQHFPDLLDDDLA